MAFVRVRSFAHADMLSNKLSQSNNVIQSSSINSEAFIIDYDPNWDISCLILSPNEPLLGKDMMEILQTKCYPLFTLVTKRKERRPLGEGWWVRILLMFPVSNIRKQQSSIGKKVTEKITQANPLHRRRHAKHARIFLG